MENQVFFELGSIDPNPYQPRESEDPEHIRNLSISIAQDGLLQAPVGRKTVDGQIQLAFGHSRLAAYRFLHETGNAGFSTMPVVLRSLNDEDMFRLAISENLQRRDLTPIEEAKAMMRYRDEFGKSSGEIGGLFGLSDSAVRNKMRLLNLPLHLQDALRDRLITEGVARALVGMYNLPEDWREAMEDQEQIVKPSEVVEIALSGVSPSQVTALVTKLDERYSQAHPKFVQSDLGQFPKIHLNPLDPTAGEKTELQPAPPPPLPAPVPPMREENVSTETVSKPPSAAEKSVLVYEFELKDEQAEEETEQETEEETSERKNPAAIQETKPVSQPTVIQSPAPAPATAIAPIEPAQETTTWEKATVSLTLTFWPDDGNTEGRMVVLGARVNQAAPVMRMFRESGLLPLSKPVVDLLSDLKNQFGGEQ